MRNLLKFTALVTSLLAAATPFAVNADTGLVGDWQLRVEGRRGVQTPVLSVAENDGNFSGRIGGQRGQVQIDTIAVDGQAFTFPFKMDTPMGGINTSPKRPRQVTPVIAPSDNPVRKVSPNQEKSTSNMVI